MTDLFDNQSDKNKEISTVLLNNENVRIEKIVSCGQTSPEGFYYDQNEDEWVAILDGSGTIEYEDGSYIILSKGDNMLIPAHKKHRVSFTSENPPCIWLCVFNRKADV